MERTIQTHLIQWLLQPLANLANRVPEKLREIIFTLSGLMIFLVYFLNANGNLANVRYLVWFAFDCLMLGIMILCLMPKEIKPLVFDKTLLIPWGVFSVFMLIAGITKNYDVLPDAMLLLVAYPIFFVVGTNYGFGKIIPMLFRIVHGSFLIFLVVSILFFPISGRQYGGFFHNTNGIAFYLVLVFCCGILTVLCSNGKKLPYIVGILSSGISISLIYYSASRTGLLSAVCTFAFTVVLILLMDRKLFLFVLLTRLLPIVLSIAIFIPCTLYLFQLPQMVSDTIQSIQTEQTVPTPDPEPVPIPDPEPVPIPDPEPVPTPEPEQPSVSEIFSEIKEANDQKTGFDGKDLDSYSTGRIAIWKGYLPLLTFWGHAEKADVYITETRHYGSAHQTILDMAYDCGILAGLSYLLFNILAGIKSIRYALRHRNSRYALVPFAVTITFGVLSVLATTYTSFYYMASFYYYLVQCPLMTREGFDQPI